MQHPCLSYNLGERQGFCVRRIEAISACERIYPLSATRDGYERSR